MFFITKTVTGCMVAGQEWHIVAAVEDRVSVPKGVSHIPCQEKFLNKIGMLSWIKFEAD